MDEREHEHAEDHVEDLDVPESESDEVKGGLNFTADQFSSKIEQKVQKIGVQSKIRPGGLGSFGDGSV
jgi:hypothetical protein